MNFAVLAVKEIVFSILGGIAIFLFGITLMSDFLKKIAGTKLKLILEKTTNNVFKGLLAGLVLTSLIQSSSATVAIVIGLVSANLLNLKNAVGIIFGAKIGTTVTSILISFNLGSYALLIVFIGIIMYLFFKQKLVKNIGGAILGFGLLFLGLNIMSDALTEVTTTPAFTSFLTSAGNHPILGLLIGIGAAALIQSSSAVIGIVQQIYTTGNIPLIVAIALVIGANIGTTITSVIAAINASSKGKKVALLHVLISVVSGLLFFALIRPYTSFMVWLSTLFALDPTKSMLTIALAHIILNIISVLLLIGLTKLLIWFVNIVIKDKEEIIKQSVILDKKLVTASPELALQNTDEAIKEMGEIMIQMFGFAQDYAFHKDEKAHEFAQQCEEKINELDIDIHNYLVGIGAQDLNERQMQKVIKNIDTVTDLERIGDHLENLMEFFALRHEHKISLSAEVNAEFSNLFTLVKTQLVSVVPAYYEKNIKVATTVLTNENEINTLFKEYRTNNAVRISQDLQENYSNHYVDIISNLERIGDHCYNIAENIISKDFIHTKKAVKA